MRSSLVAPIALSVVFVGWCVDTPPVQAGPPQTTGPSAKQVHDCAQTHPGVNEERMCAGRELGALDDRLNDVYSRLRQTYGPTSPRRDQLRDAQRAWIAYRDANCEWKTDEYSEGTIYPFLQFTCVADMTEQRLHELELELAWMDGSDGANVAPVARARG